ncbi:MAG: DUF2953 domain-containing protein [Clostridia bacterium]|nr:DUF2953 domain-containing protein [Clostridia bacterium]
MHLLWIIPLCLILLLIGTLLFLPLRLIFTFEKTDESAALRLWLKVGFFKTLLVPGKKKKKKAKPKKEKTKKKTSVSEKIESAISLYNRVWDDLKEILVYAAKNSLKFEDLTFHLNYGTGDAAYTGISYGVISGIVYGIWGIIANNAILKKYDINISPDYQKACLSLDGRCIVKVRNVHIIIIAIKTLKLIRKIRKESD